MARRTLPFVMMGVVACGAPARPLTDDTTVPTNLQDTHRWKTSPQGPPLPVTAVFDHGDDARAVYKMPLAYDDLRRDYERYLPSAGLRVSTDRQVMGATSTVFDVTDAGGATFTIVLTKEDENSTQIELIRDSRDE